MKKYAISMMHVFLAHTNKMTYMNNRPQPCKILTGIKFASAADDSGVPVTDVSCTQMAGVAVRRAVEEALADHFWTVHTQVAAVPSTGNVRE
jgi:hypothetical protein